MGWILENLCTLQHTDIAMEHGPFIDDLAIKDGAF
jgi:hypothetical protein